MQDYKEQELLTTEQATEQVDGKILLLLSVIDKPLTRAELQKLTSIKHRPTFIYNYLNVVIEAGYIERENPNAPSAPSQKYHLTERGKMILSKYEHLVSNTNDTVNDTILDIIRNNGGISATKIAELINKSHISTKRYVTVLKRQDLIEYKGSKKTGGYWIKK